jgi:hypothetical protein
MVITVLLIDPASSSKALIEVPVPVELAQLRKLISADRMEARTLKCDASTGAGDVLFFDDTFLTKPDLPGFTVRIPGGTPARIAGRAVIVRCDAAGQHQSIGIDPDYQITFDKQQGV